MQEFAETYHTTVSAIRIGLQRKKREGKLESRRSIRPAIDGRMMPVPVYRVIP